MDISLKKRIPPILLIALAPIVSVLVMCAFWHVSPFDIFIPASDWNDELFYYKQVESIIRFGRPLGYFGYNESHAVFGNMGAWSPVIYAILALWGRLFGWTYSTPIWCNITIITLGLILFGIVCKPSIRQALKIFVMYICYIPMTRFVLSCTPEASIMALSMIYMAFFLHMKSRKDCICMYIIGTVLTLMRPFYIVLLILPGIIWFFEFGRRKLIWAINTAYIAIVFSLWYLLSKFFCSPYFAPLINTTWIKKILNEPIAGIKLSAIVLFEAVKNCLRLSWKGFVSSNSIGDWYATFFCIIACLVINTLFFRNDKGSKLRYICMLSCFVLVLAGIFMLYDINAGSRHVMTFGMLSIFVFGMTEPYDRAYLFVGGLLLWIFLARGGGDEYYTRIPADSNGELRASINQNMQTLSEKMRLADPDCPWDNTIIWSEHVRFNDLYALPVGFGINLCREKYVYENFYELKPKYIAVASGEYSDELCENSNKELVAEYNSTRIYRLW